MAEGKSLLDAAQWPRYGLDESTLVAVRGSHHDQKRKARLKRRVNLVGVSPSCWLRSIRAKDDGASVTL
jgi:hypothetical protein